MSPARYAATYGPSPLLVQRAQAVLQRAGLSATWRRGDDWLVVAGPAQRVEAESGVCVHTYTGPDGATFYASPRDPTIPLALRPLATAASHITSGFA